jgi:hypothetical protein
VSVAVHCPLATSQTFTVLSFEPVTAVCPSALIATLSTEREWPVSVSVHRSLAASHSFADLSSEPVATVRPSALIATLLTQPE